MEYPLISIVIPMYNAAEFIARAVYSVVNQSYSNLEIIVIDNCSTDNSVDIVKGIDDPRIKLYVNETNIGFAGNINEGIDYANGEYIKFLCADDELKQDAIEQLLETVVKNNVQVLYCNCDYVDEHNNFVYGKASYKKNIDLEYNLSNCQKILSGKYNILCCVSFLFIKNEPAIEDRVHFITIDGSDYNSDFVYLFDIFRKYKRLYYLNNKLVLSRRHSRQGTYNVSGTGIFFNPLKFVEYIVNANGIHARRTLRFKCRFRIFKNGCNAYLKYQHKIPKDVYKATKTEFGLGYYLILFLYLPFVYIPKKVCYKLMSLFKRKSKIK